MAEQELRVSDHQVRKGQSRSDILIPVLSVAVVAAIVLGFLYVYGFLPFDDQGEYSHSFVLTIETDLLEEYVVMCPLPVDSTGLTYDGFMDELTGLDGEVSASIVETPYGRALEIRGSSNATLRWDADWDDDGDWYRNLTMTFDDVNETTSAAWAPWMSGMSGSWMYSDRGNLSLRLSYEALHTYLATPRWASGGGPCFDLMGTDGDRTYEAQAGWQLAPMDYSLVAIN